MAAVIESVCTQAVGAVKGASMLSVAFQTNVEDGIIRIPAEYQQEFHNRVTVILLRNEPIASEDDIIGDLLAHPIQAKNFRPLSRAELYAR